VPDCALVFAATLIDNSTASAPELLKNTVSAKLLATSRSAELLLARDLEQV